MSVSILKGVVVKSELLPRSLAMIKESYWRFEVDFWPPLNAKGLRHFQMEDILRTEITINAFSGLLPFNTYMWTTASSGYTTSTDPNLVQ